MWVGKPVDEEGDLVTVTFDNNGESLISFKPNSNEIYIAKELPVGSYTVWFRLKDNNKKPRITNY